VKSVLHGPHFDRPADAAAAGGAAAGYSAALRAVTAASLIAAWLLVVLGDTVRVTESGMGCASWPSCNGSFGLPLTYHAFLEQSHRYLAAVVTVLIGAVMIGAWRRARRDRLIVGSAVAAVGLIAVQVVLGAVTVFAHNAGWTVALHLAGSWLVLAAVTVTALGVWLPSRTAAPAGWLGVSAAGALIAVSVSGMVVLHGGAANACPGWPVCVQAKASAGLVALQYAHRIFVALSAALIVAAALRVFGSAAAGRADKVLASAVLALLAGTTAVGAYVAVSGAPDGGQDAHLAVASALWITLVALATSGVSRRAIAADQEETPAVDAIATAADAGG
jgi:heme A synthase